jgi:hypothetical protein
MYMKFVARTADRTIGKLTPSQVAILGISGFARIVQQ